MKKKKAVKLGIVVAIIFIIIGVIGTIEVEKMTELSKKSPITFLEDHEDELTNYIKNNSDFEVSKVTYYWDNVRESTVGNGTPSGAGKVIQIFGFINNQKQLDFRLDVQLDNDIPDLDTIKYGQQITEEGN